MKVNIFKKFVPVLSCIAAGLMPVISCTEVEPIEMQVGGVEKDYASIRAFKATEHPLSLTWISSWRADGSMDSYLSALPDSLDMVVVESGYGDLSVAQLADLSSVRETRGTKVIVSLDMDAVAATYGEDILQAEIDGENNAYEAAEAENPDGVTTEEEIEAAVAIETAKVQDYYSARVTSLVDGILAEVEKYSYDGILLRVNSITDRFFRELVDGTLDRLDGKGLFILEGTPDYFASGLDRFDFIISTLMAQDRISAYQEEYDRLSRYSGFDASRFLVYLSLETADCLTPYPDVISSQPLTDPKYKTLALWNPAGSEQTGGLALRGSASDAGDGYSILRKTIQYLQLK